MMNEKLLFSTDELSIIQIVPGEWCRKCNVCCRFPEKESFLAPYFTDTEIKKAIEVLPLSCFRRSAGCNIELTPFQEGFICPAFKPDTNKCTIYKSRPVDCRLYPFAIMESATGDEVILGVDKKCPFIRENLTHPEIRKAAVQVASVLELFPFHDIFLKNQSLIGIFQEDVYPLVTLQKLSEAIK